MVADAPVRRIANEETPECVEFMDAAPLSDEDRALIYAHNAERAFGIAAAAAAAS